ncbi:MAG: DMT family transporter [Hyphomicrobiales bacterium]
MQKEKSNSGVLEMTIAMVLSGFIGLFVFESGQDPFTVVFFRCVFGAALLGAYCWWRGLLTAEMLLSKNMLYILLGGAALIANWIFLFSSFTYASISISTVTYHFQPFFLLILNAIFFREKIKYSKIIWLLLAFIGLLLIIELDWSQISFSNDEFLGMLMALAAGFLYAVATLIVKKVKNVKSELVAFVQISLGILLLWPFVDFMNLAISNYQWLNILALGFFNTFIMYIIMYRAFAKLDVSIISVLVFIYPVVAIVVDYVFYAQNLSMVQIGGIILVLLAALMVNIGDKIFTRAAKA